MRCRLLLLVIAVSVCLSCGSSRLYCAKVAEQSKLLFGVSTPCGPCNIVSDWDPDPPQTGEELGKILLISGPSAYLRNG